MAAKEDATIARWEANARRGSRYTVFGLGLLAAAGCGISTPDGVDGMPDASAEVSVDLSVAPDGPPDPLLADPVCPDGGPKTETGLFQQPVRLKCPDQCGSLRTGDVDRDGDLDFTVHVHGIQLYLNDGKGGFSQRTAAPGHYSTHLLADWDGDGDLDIVAVLTLDAYGVVVFENRGGAFVERERILSGVIPIGGPYPPPDTGGANVKAIALGDLDGRPPIDLLMSADWEFLFRLRGLIFLFRDGVQKRYEKPWDFWNPFDVANVVDVDRDGIKDLVYAYKRSARAGLVYGLRGRDWGVVKDLDLQEPWGDRFGYVGTADLDKNGLNDVVGFRTPLEFGGNGLALMTARQVAPRVWASALYCCGDAAVASQLADLNGDGAMDVVFSMFGQGRIGFLLNRGNGEFRPLRIADTKGGNLTSMVLGDFDGDGRQDILHTEGAPSPASIVLLRNLGKW